MLLLKNENRNLIHLLLDSSTFGRVLGALAILGPIVLVAFIARKKGKRGSPRLEWIFQDEVIYVFGEEFLVQRSWQDLNIETNQNGVVIDAGLNKVYFLPKRCITDLVKWNEIQELVQCMFDGRHDDAAALVRKPLASLRKDSAIKHWHSLQSLSAPLAKSTGGIREGEWRRFVDMRRYGIAIVITTLIASFTALMLVCWETSGAILGFLQGLCGTSVVLALFVSFSWRDCVIEDRTAIASRSRSVTILRDETIEERSQFTRVFSFLNGLELVRMDDELTVLKTKAPAQTSSLFALSKRTFSPEQWTLVVSKLKSCNTNPGTNRSA